MSIKYVITDLAWFSKVLNNSFKEPTHTIGFKDIVGESVPVWEFNRFKENLSNYIQKEKVGK